jgi:hypothetical protein
MSKATWDEEVEFEDKPSELNVSDQMVENPQEQKEEEVEYKVKDETEESKEEETHLEGEDINPKIDEIKYKLKEYEKLRRQNYAQSELMRRLKAERDHFQAKAFEQYESNLAHNEGLLENKLRLAKARLELAMEENDSATVSDLNLEIAELTSDMREFKKEKEQWNSLKEEESAKKEYLQAKEKERGDQNLNWFYSNPEFNPQNPNFDKKLQKEFINYARQIDEELINQGKGAVIGSQEYYDYFENVMDSYRASRSKNSLVDDTKKTGAKASFNPVAPVSRGNTGAAASPSSAKKGVVHISPEEARINKLWGITPKEHVEFTQGWKDKDFEMEGY